MEQELKTVITEEAFLDIEGAYKLRTGFFKADGTEIVFYESSPEGSIAPVLQDCGLVLQDAWDSGVILKPSALKELVKTYGLKLTEQLHVFDDGGGKIFFRRKKFAQCLMALDGIIRMWQVNAPARSIPESE